MAANVTSPSPSTWPSNAGYSINFWADRDTIDAGQCTALRWDVRNVQAVYLDGEGVAGVSEREVCPGDTKNYNLTVTKNDGGQDSRQVTVKVNNAQPQQPSARIQRFDVDRNLVFIGDCVTLEWRTDDAEGVGLLRNGDDTSRQGRAMAISRTATRRSASTNMT